MVILIYLIINVVVILIYDNFIKYIHDQILLYFNLESHSNYNMLYFLVLNYYYSLYFLLDFYYIFLMFLYKKRSLLYFKELNIHIIFIIKLK
jgi:hypothetical protein